MAKARSTRKNVAAKSPASRRRESKEKWVRKNVVIDQRKLDIAKRNFGVATEKEAIDRALDYVKFYCELSEGLETIRLSGGLVDVWKGR
jgi:hypothetical protein